MLSTSLSVGVEVLLERPPEDVWRVVSDPGLTAQWLGDFRVGRAGVGVGEPRVGTVVRYTLKGGRTGTYELVQREHGRRLAWDGPGLPWLAERQDREEPSK